MAIRRASVRKSDLNAATSALMSQGLKPCAVDVLPNGGFRLHFVAPPSAATFSDAEDMDRELADFEARHSED